MYKVLITAGPTHEYIDPIRYITNNASGKQGYAIAECLYNLGWQVKLVSGPTHIKPQSNYEVCNVYTCKEMLTSCEAFLPVDVAIFTAAVTDWCPNYSSDKIKKYDLSTISIEYNPDIVKHISTHPTLRPKLVIGFALESNNIIANATKKLIDKQCDWIIANSLEINNQKVIGGNHTQISIITKESCEEIPYMTKSEAATVIVNKIINFLK